MATVRLLAADRGHFRILHHALGQTDALSIPALRKEADRRGLDLQVEEDPTTGDVLVSSRPMTTDAARRVAYEGE